ERRQLRPRRRNRGRSRRRHVGIRRGHLRATARGGGGMTTTSAVLGWTVVACLIYVLAVYGAYLGMLGYSAVEAHMRHSRRRLENLERMRESPLTIPVSIVAPVHNEEPIVLGATRSFLAVDYPEHEVIVVNDGSTDGTLAALEREFDLRPIELFY